MIDGHLQSLATAISEVHSIHMLRAVLRPKSYELVASGKLESKTLQVQSMVCGEQTIIWKSVSYVPKCIERQWRFLGSRLVNKESPLSRFRELPRSHISLIA